MVAQDFHNTLELNGRGHVQFSLPCDVVTVEYLTESHPGVAGSNSQENDSVTVVMNLEPCDHQCKDHSRWRRPRCKHWHISVTWKVVNSQRLHFIAFSA